MAEAWRPGVTVTDEVKIVDIACALSFGQQDPAFDRIAEVLSKRGCKSVADWGSWTKEEFFTLIKTNVKELGLTKNRHAYLKGFESCTGRQLGVDDGDGFDPLKKEKKPSGGDMMGLSRKVAASDEFRANKWRPDSQVYHGVPTKGAVDYLGPEEEKLYMDKLWLALQARLHGMPNSLARARARAATRAADVTSVPHTARSPSRRRTPSRLSATTSRPAWRTPLDTCTSASSWHPSSRSTWARTMSRLASRKT